MLDVQKIKDLIGTSKMFCSECDEETPVVSFCSTCQMYLCKDHQIAHKKSKKTKLHQQVSVTESMNHLSVSPSSCEFHREPFGGFCQTCFQLCCHHCSFSTHKAPEHVTYPFSEANRTKEQEFLQLLIDEGLKAVGEMKTSIQEVGHMLDKAKERSASLINASNKYFFDLLQRILPEIQASIAAELEKNQNILQDQKTRSEVQLFLLEKELQNAQFVIQSKNTHGIIASKVELFNLLSFIAPSFSVPQRTDDINLSVAGYEFHSPNEKLNQADMFAIVSAIVESFNRLFNLKFSIPTLEQIKGTLTRKQQITYEQKQREYRELERKENKEKEAQQIKERSVRVQAKKNQDLRDIYIQLQLPVSMPIFTSCQHQVEEWIGKKAWELIYRASRDGFEGKSFHSKCDNTAPTITLITSSNGFLFGGYTPIPWNSNGSFIQDPSKESFIFTFTNPNRIPPTKYSLKDAEKAIYCKAECGPIFGGNDIHFGETGNDFKENYTCFPYAYMDTTSKGNSTFTGEFNFAAQEIEVYKLTD